MPRFVELPPDYSESKTPEAIIAAQHALVAEGIAILVMALGAVVWINVYSIWAQMQ